MNRLNSLEPEFVDEIPSIKTHGKLYVCERFNIAVHLCACGCGFQSVTPIKPNFWELKNNDGKVTLRPSIGNFSGQHPHHAHYYITENKIQWLK